MTPPPGYVRPSLAQVRQADEMAFVLLAELTEAGLQTVGASGTPLDVAMQDVLRDDRFTMLPRPNRPSRAASRSRTPRRQRAQRTRGDRKKGKEDVKMDKGKGKGGPKLPQALQGIGAVARDEEEEPICFGYNIRGQGCANAKAGERCNRGMHVCCKKGCFKNHPVFEHPKKR